MSPVNPKIVLKALSPKFMMRAIESFDRVTALIVGICWAAAAVMIGFTLYALSLSSHARQGAETAQIAEPVLPKIVRRKVDAHDVQNVVDRFQRRYPGLSITFKGTLNISASDGAKFREWLAALSYIDAVAPQIHWTMEEFCVGHCGSDLMAAVLAGEKVSFEKPQLETND
jgi:hypothetical protein